MPAETPPADRDLRDRYAAAIDAVTGGICPADIIDAVLAVRDDELERLRGELTEVREENAYLHPAMRGAENRRQMWRERAEQAEAAIERVRALCERGPGQHNEHQIWITDVIAALDAPSGAHSPASGRTGVNGHTDATQEATDAQEASE
jgi:hypothetical protein